MVLSRQSVKGLPLCFNSFRELFHFSLVLFPFPLKTMCWEYLSFFSLATPCGIWDLSSLTRDWTHTFWIRRQSFNHFLKVFNYIIVLESFFTSFSWILKLRGIFLQSHIVRFSWQSSKALFLFVGSQKSSLKHGSLLSCPTFLHDLQWWIFFFFFFVKNGTPQHTVYGKSIPDQSPDADFQVLFDFNSRNRSWRWWLSDGALSWEVCAVFTFCYQ